MTSQGGAGSDDPSQGGTGPDSETLRRRWPEVLDTLSRMRRSTWILVSQNAQVQTLAGTVLRLRFDTAGIASTFRSGPHAEAVQRALRETLGLDVRVEAVVEGGSDGSGGPGRDGPAAGGRGSGRAERTSDAVIRAAADWADPAPHPPGAPRAGSRSGPQPEGGDGPYDLDDQGGWQADPATVEAGGPPPAGEDGANGEDSAGAAPTWRQQEEPAGPAASRLGTAPQPRPDTAPQPRPDAAPAPGPGIAPAPRPAGQAASRPGGQAAPRPGDGPAAPRPSGAPQQEPDLPDEPDFSDEDLEESYLVGAPLVEQVLGGTLIDDIPVDPAGSSSPDGT